VTKEEKNKIERIMAKDKIDSLLELTISLELSLLSFRKMEKEVEALREGLLSIKKVLGEDGGAK